KSLQETVRAPQKVVRNVGDVQAEFAKGGKVHEAEYYVPHLSHAPMEPPAAVAEFKDGKVVVWAATQNPQAVQDAVASGLGINKKDVECHVTLLGGGFGRKSKPDYVVEAALISKAVGKPVKVVWSREDDIRFDYYHAVAAMYMKAATDEKGKPTAWLQRSAFPTIGSMFSPAANSGQAFELGMGWTDMPFDVPNHRAENGPAKNHVRIGWLRSVANIYHAFAIHSFVDELAQLAKRDSVEYLLDVLGPARKIDLRAQGASYPNYGKPAAQFPVDTGRLRRVIEIAAEKSGWGKKKLAKGRALGIAAHRSFLTYVAAVVEIDVDARGQIRIPRVDFAVDAGRVINPDRVKAQFEGAAVFGASAALFGEISAANGQIKQSNFHDYRVARMNEAPIVTNVHLVPSEDLPAGVGEPGVPPILPAICNAIFAATGKRIRDLPVRKHKLV
ncbi:MAG TPA: molybdopterin cofactor-binding domain-containing protein, partial [Blastocatellia bacterium]|nr:molybdopterin cofactor-binding domain-containing protein [Blastocatellia bacterium]